MFRSSSELPNPLDPVINKATSETLTQDNWEYILDACDQVSTDPEDGAHNAILSIEKRLKVKDGNVLLRTCSLITALAENCGSKMKQEIATKKFCSILKDLIKDRHVYLPIKYKIVEMIEQLSKSFANDPSLRILNDTLKDIKLSYPDLVSSYKQSASGPQKPQKHDLTKSDKLKEQEELDLALKLSLQEYEQGRGGSSSNRGGFDQGSSSSSRVQAQAPANAGASSTGATQQQQQQASAQQPQQSVSENTQSNIATVSRVKALYDLTSYEPDELSFRKNDVITVIESVYKDWWRGSLGGKIGIFPLNYVTPLKEPTTEELMFELKQEHQLLQKTTEVEKLLSLLSNFSTRLVNNRVSPEELSSMIQDDQLSSFYKDIVSLRPELAKLIEKYSVKRDEMINLNKKLVDSERLYNELMESSFNRFMQSRPISTQQQPPPSQQQQYQRTSSHSQQPPQQATQQPQQQQYMNQSYQAPQQQQQQAQYAPPPVNYGSAASSPHLQQGQGQVPGQGQGQYPAHQQPQQPQHRQQTGPPQPPPSRQQYSTPPAIPATTTGDGGSGSPYASPSLQFSKPGPNLNPGSSSASGSPYPTHNPHSYPLPQQQQQNNMSSTSVSTPGTTSTAAPIAQPPYPNYGF